MTGRDGKIVRGDAALKAIYEALRETQTPKGRVSRWAGGFSRPGAGIRGCREAAHRLARSGWCASWRSARLPPVIHHRGAHAAEPDSRVDAVFIQVGGGGATVGFSYKLFIVPRGAKPNTTGELLLADKIGNVSAVWSKPRKLEIRYDQARIFSFVNFWQSKDVDNFKYVVEVQLVPSGPSQLGDIYK